MPKLEAQKLRKIFKLFAVVTLVLLGWFWGVATVNYRVFPYEAARSARDAVNCFSAFGNGIFRFRDFPCILGKLSRGKSHSIDDSALQNSATYAKESFKAISAKSGQVRESLIRKLIIDREHVEILKADVKKMHSFLKQMKIEGVVELYNVKFYGIGIYGVLSKSSNDSNCLIIYNQGHGDGIRAILNGNPFNYSYHNKIRDEILSKNCDMLSLSMLGIGKNQGDAGFPSSFVEENSYLHLTAEQASHHSSYRSFYDKEQPNLDPIALFLSGHFWLISDISKNYDSVLMMGVSGGGWYTTMLSALTPAIDHSISFAGSLPKIFKINVEHKGDWENINSDIWKEFDYWDFYFLSLFDKHGLLSRKSHLVYYNKDPIAFMDPNASTFKSMADDLDISNLRVSVIDYSKHDIQVDFALKLISAR